MREIDLTPIIEKIEGTGRLFMAITILTVVFMLVSSIGSYSIGFYIK